MLFNWYFVGLKQSWIKDTFWFGLQNVLRQLLDVNIFLSIVKKGMESEIVHMKKQ